MNNSNPRVPHQNQVLPPQPPPVRHTEQTDADKPQLAADRVLRQVQAAETTLTPQTTIQAPPAFDAAAAVRPGARRVLRGTEALDHARRTGAKLSRVGRTGIEMSADDAARVPHDELFLEVDGAALNTASPRR